MGLWVRNEKKLNMHCSKAISKDTRAARSDCTQQMLSRAARITRLFFEPPILWLRRKRFDRKSTKIWSEIVGNPCQIVPKIDEQSILSRPGRPKSFCGRLRTRSERLLDTQMTAQGRSRDARVDEERPRAVHMRARAAPETLQELQGQLPRCS